MNRDMLTVSIQIYADKTEISMTKGAEEREADVKILN